MKPKFIKLIEIESGNPRNLIIYIDNIRAIKSFDDETIVYMKHGKDFWVKETTDQILKLIEEA